MSLAFLAAGALAAAPPAAAPAPAAPPRNPWVVDYAETFCTAVRSFGEPDHAVQLALRPSPTGDVLQLFVIRKGSFAEAEHVPVTVGFDGRSIRTTALRYGPWKGNREILLTTLGREGLTAAAQTGRITISGGGGVRYDLVVPDMAKVMAALGTCNADLRRHWNIGETAGARIATPSRPVKSLHSYFSSTDYPAQALREEDSGKARVLLLIDEQGKVSDCLLEQTSGNASLDAMTCIVLVQRARFHPAVDASGKPVRSAQVQAINWRVAP